MATCLFLVRWLKLEKFEELPTKLAALRARSQTAGQAHLPNRELTSSRLLIVA